MQFSDTEIIIKPDRIYNIKRKYASWSLRKNLISKIEHFESNEHKFSHKTEKNIAFMTDLRNRTYEHYIKIPKPMIEWTIIKKISSSPKLIKAFNISTSHPLIRKYNHNINDEET